jgi:ATP-dependent protease ClpP protease subunit
MVDPMLSSRLLNRAGRSRPMAKARPGKITVPSQASVSAIGRPQAFERWRAGIKAAAPAENTITIYDVIGEDFWSGGGVTVNRIDAALRSIGQDQPVEVLINSPGGDMFEGIAIYNRLREHGGPVTVKVIGLAASAASIVAMAGERIEIGAASFLMIHNCWVVAIGNRHDFRETADFLEPFDDAMAAVYAARTGLDKTKVAAMLDGETWLNGEQAVAQGFADALLPADAVAEDEAATARANDVNPIRALELELVASGKTRAEARERIRQIKGTPGAAPNDGTPGAADPQLQDAMASLLRTLKG